MNSVEERYDESTQIARGASMVAGDSALEGDGISSFVRERPHSEHEISSVEMDSMHRADQTKPIININESDEVPLSITESSGPVLALIPVRPPVYLTSVGTI